MGGRLRAALLLLMMFVLGLASGMSVEHYHMTHHPAYTVFPNPRLAHFYDELGLTTEQRTQMDAIFAKAHQRAAEINEEVAWDLKEVHHDSLTAIQAVLTPDQRVRFDALRHRLQSRQGRRHHLEPLPPAPAR